MLTDNNHIFSNCFVIIYCHLTKVSSQINKCIIFEPNELSITLSTLWWYIISLTHHLYAPSSVVPQSDTSSASHITSMPPAMHALPPRWYMHHQTDTPQMQWRQLCTNPKWYIISLTHLRCSDESSALPQSDTSSAWHTSDAVTPAPKTHQGVCIYIYHVVKFPSCTAIHSVASLYSFIYTWLIYRKYNGGAHQ